MSQINKAIKELESQRARVESALRVLRNLNGNMGGPSGKPRNLSAEGRQRIVEAQRKRWAKVRGAKKQKPRAKAGRKATAEPANAAPASE